MSDIATISLRVNTAELERGNKALDDFQQTAGGAANKADDLNSVFRAGASDQKKNTQSLKEQQQELQNLLNKISPVNRAMNELETLQTSLAGFHGKGLLGDEDFGRFSAVLDTTRNKLFQVMEAETAEGQERLKLAQETERASAAQNTFLKSLADQAATFRASRSDALEYKAALMGMSEEAAPLIQQIRQRELSLASEAEQNRLAAQALREKQTAERQASAEASRLQSQNDNFVESLRNQAQAIGKSRAELLELKATQMGLSQETAPYIAALKEQEAATARDAANKRVAAQQSRMLKEAIAELEATERAEAAELRRNQNIRDSFISSLQDQANAMGKTRIELLEMRAAQLGVSEQAAPFIAKLGEQERVFNKGTLSAGQYQQALRMLPAQFTDIATSIAGGMPLWMVLIQQGGQISDSFGGIGGLFQVIKEELLGIKDASDDSSESLSENANALAENAEHASGLLRFLTPARLAVGGFTAILGGMAIAAWQAEQANRELYQSIVLTGGASATSTAQLWKMAEQIGESTTASTNSVSETLARLAQSGKFTTAQLQLVAQTSQQWTQVMGSGAEKIEASFAEIMKSPVKALAELNSQYNFLTVSQLNYIAGLEDSDKKQEAVSEGMRIFADTMQKRMQQIDDASTPLEQMWDSIKKWSADAWKWVGDHTIGALNLIIDVVAGTVEQVQILLKQGDVLIAEFANSAYEKTKNIPGMKSLFGDMATDNKAFIAQTKKDIAELEKSYTARDARVRKGEMGYVNRDRSTAVDRGPNQQSKVTDRAQQILKDRQKKTRGAAVSAGDSAEDKAQADLLALQAQLRVLKEHQGINDVISQQRKDLWKTEAQFAVLEEAAGKRKLSKQEQSLLASKDQVLELARQKALLGDQITAQEQLNKRMDTASKYVTQMAEKRTGLESGATMSDRLAGRQTALSQLRSGWINAGGSLEDEGYQKELKAANDYYEAEDKLRGDWRAGFKKGWSEYLDSATNVYASMQSIAQSALGGISDMMTNLVTTGTASFKSFAASMMKMIADVINRLLVAYAVQSALGWVTGSVSGGGGSTPSGSYTAAAANVSFDGGGYTGPGGKYEPAGIVHKDEFVFTKEATAAIGVDNLYAMMRSAQGYASGGLVGRAPMFGLGNNAGAASSAPVIQTTVHVDANGNASAQSEGSGDAMGRALAAEMQNAAIQVVQKHIKNGGLIYNFVKGR
ncbi:phage tail tape measure protein [Pseudescherichia sp.]|uniref:phage tail tape measure protein n=1 Tax=Pseudescherichia sp. TaxID=2055881 RepID=UPI002897FA50|nr:phage tail tape measure protein [Pseudescherichia sp.]